jgi:hypothetical protein
MNVTSLASSTYTLFQANGVDVDVSRTEVRSGALGRPTLLGRARLCPA